VTSRAGGDYESVEDFRQRVPAKSINAKAMEALEESGAFDCFGARRLDRFRDRQGGEGTARDEPHRGGGSEKYAEMLRENIYTQDECNNYSPGTSVIVGGEITKVEKKLTKKGSPFANVTIVFEMNEWRVKFWSESLAQYEHMLEVGNAIMVSGKTDEFNGFVSVVARDVTDQLEQMEA
jgi:DNA polymerase III alpha subunit